MREWMNIRTDLAIEAEEMMTQKVSHPIAGVDVITSKDDDAVITRVSISSNAAEEALGKQKGTYITIEAEGLVYNDRALHAKVMNLLAQELAKLAQLPLNASVLVVGLGNRNITPDALGPKTVGKLVVTRHLEAMMPKELAGGMRSVCAIEPGVLGITGMETAEIIQGIAAQIKPDLIIAVDALAAAVSRRMNTTVQIADTGIHPGSGVDNKRFGLNKETMGVPVIAIGVPTVIHACHIASDTIQTLREHAVFSKYLRSMESLSQQDQQIIVRQILPDSLGNLMVTPKEIDQLIDTLSNVLAGGINQALHPHIDYENIQLYLH